MTGRPAKNGMDDAGPWEIAPGEIRAAADTEQPVSRWLIARARSRLRLLRRFNARPPRCAFDGDEHRRPHSGPRAARDLGRLARAQIRLGGELEVGEHIPRQFEHTFISNIVNHATPACPELGGRRQRGTGRINSRSNAHAAALAREGWARTSRRAKRRGRRDDGLVQGSLGVAVVARCRRLRNSDFRCERARGAAPPPPLRRRAAPAEPCKNLWRFWPRCALRSLCPWRTSSAAASSPTARSKPPSAWRGPRGGSGAAPPDDASSRRRVRLRRRRRPTRRRRSPRTPTPRSSRRAGARLSVDHCITTAASSTRG